MKRTIMGSVLLTFAAWLCFGQSTEGQATFEAADVHVSDKTTNPFVKAGPARGGRYEVKTATMVDLIRIAHGFDPDKILGGPNWLEMDRFDVIAKVPADSTPETHKLMLQALLADRFKLVVHKDTKPLPTYALTVGKKLQLKEASGSEETGCKPATSGGAPEGTIRLFTSSLNGAATSITLGPGGIVQYNCRNMTMAKFAAGLRGMMGVSVGPNPVLDETGLKGNWNFDLKYSIQIMMPMMGGSGDRISIFDAVDKQLGLKLEEKQVPTPVMMVDSVSRKPTENPPSVAEVLPSIPAPTEFEVAVIKPVESAMGPGSRMRFQMQPGGHLVVNTDRYDINAKTTEGAAPAGQMDNDAMAPMILNLLKDRFKMTYHTEDRPVTAYSLVSGKSKMKKADPASRTYCRNGNAPAGAPPGSRALTCQNITLAQFAERLQNLTQDLSWPVLDATGIEGGWDFTLTFTMGMPTMMGSMLAARGGGGEGGPGAGGMAAAPEPTDGYTIFEAIEKQLGLKLEKQKRTLPVIVIDHIEQKPTEN